MHRVTIRVRFGLLCLVLLLLTGYASRSAHAVPQVSALRISQIYGGGGNAGAPYSHDFIELFNSGSTSISLSGWSVQVAPASGIVWAVTPLNGNIAPGGYYLVQGNSGGGSGVALPTPNATASIDLSADSGMVVVVKSTTPFTPVCSGTGNQRDFVGYGTADCYETAAVGTLNNAAAALRNEGGCTDSDNNAADFTIAAPAPRNGASPARNCALIDAVVQPPCNEAAFNTALATVQAGGGGTLTFNCGSAPLAIIFSAEKNITTPVTIDGAGVITLSGGNATRLFRVGGVAAALTVQNITISHGSRPNDFGGAIYIAAGGRFSASDAIIEHNTTGDWGGSAIFSTSGGRIALMRSTVRFNTSDNYGAISSSGHVSIADSVFSDNQSARGGGALNAGGVVTITNTLFENNIATQPGSDPLFGGGAILLTASGRLTMTGGALRGNSAHNGGAIYTAGVITLRETSVVTNSASYGGGGLYVAGGRATLTNLTVADNRVVSLGGGMYITASEVVIGGVLLEGNDSVNGAGAIWSAWGSDLSVFNSTFSRNTSDLLISDSGGLAVGSDSITYLAYVTFFENNGATLQVPDSTDTYLSLQNVALKPAEGPENMGCDLSDGINNNAIITSGGGNIAGDASCDSLFTHPLDQINIDPTLLPLADNGGPTQTHMPAADSPLIDAGVCDPAVAVDQRGATRPVGLACDSGAVEVSGNVPTAITLVRQSAGRAAGWGLVVAVCLCLPFIWVGRRLRTKSAAGGIIVAATNPQATGEPHV